MTHFKDSDRQKWIGLLCRAEARELQLLFDGLDELPDFTELRPPEAGMIMVRGRIAGSGSPFNLGEMTVTRCSVSVLRHTGHAIVQGRNPDHARLAALADGLLQDESWFSILDAKLLTPLESAELERAAQRREDANGTKVDFFTMVRGEDEK